MNVELNKIKESLADCQKKMEQLKGQDLPADPRFDALYNSLSYIMKYVFALEDQLWNYQSQHRQGHLPPIKGAGKMQKILKTLDMDDDYEVEKPSIMVGSTKRGIVIEASYQSNKK